MEDGAGEAGAGDRAGHAPHRRGGLVLDEDRAARLGHLFGAEHEVHRDEDGTEDKAYVEAPGWGGPNLWFQKVPEPRTAKLRMHFDLRAPDGVAAEVKRLASLGATVAHDQGDLVVMQDPEGNEFCVER